jgi:GDP-4-dehydro-6-deoxy-D-mannose reductase
MDRKGMKEEKAIMLITGAGGFTGSHACSYFHSNGYEVYGMYRKLPLYDTKSWKKVEADLTSMVSIEKVLQDIKPQFLLHLAGSNSVAVSWENPYQSFLSNVLGTLNLLEAVRKHSPQTKLVVTGSLLQFSQEEGSRPEHPYGVTKLFQSLLSEYWFTLFSMNIVRAKPSNLIGPGPSRGICSIMAEKVIQMENGCLEPVLKVTHFDNTRDFLDVRDAVRAYEILFLRGEAGEEYEIASGKARTLGEVLRMIIGQTTVEIKISQDQDKQPDFYTANNLEKIHQLGWKPCITFEQSIQDIFKSLRFPCHKKELPS